jgi:uncharacterized protein YjbI with pentapeptide repeats
MARTRGERVEPPLTINLPALRAFADPALAASADYEAVHFVDLDLAGQVADDATFLSCRLERCGLDGVSLRRARMIECLLEEIHALSVELGDSVWRDSLFSGGRLGALKASGASWTGVRIRGGKLDFVDLGRSRLSDVIFEGCAIGELDLTGAQMRSVRFDGCTVEVLNVDGARLSDVDLSGATLRTVGGLGSLRGATISPGQLVDLAPLLAAHLGLRIRSD